MTPGPEERKLRNRAAFKLLGRWPDGVVRARLRGLTADPELRTAGLMLRSHWRAPVEAERMQVGDTVHGVELRACPMCGLEFDWCGRTKAETVEHQISGGARPIVRVIHPAEPLTRCPAGHTYTTDVGGFDGRGFWFTSLTLRDVRVAAIATRGGARRTLRRRLARLMRR